MSISITERRQGRWRNKGAKFVVAAPPPIARGGLRPNRQSKSQNGGFKKKTHGKKKNHKSKKKNLLVGLNAFSPVNIGLPRSVGDYTYVTTIENTSLDIDLHRRIHCFTPIIGFKAHQANAGGPLYHTGSTSAVFTTGYGWSSQNSAIDADPKARIELFDSTAINNVLSGAVEMVPCAMTVRITCPTALLKASGQVFMGRWNINCDPRQFSSYQEIIDGFMSYGQPRPITAPQIATEGVRCNAMPRNMNAFCDFLEGEDGTVTADRQEIAPYPTTTPIGPWDGFSPIFLVTEPVATEDLTTTLNVQVAIKWRYRFAMTNPASKTHRHQPIVGDASWNDICKTAALAGHGVEKLINAYEAFTSAAQTPML